MNEKKNETILNRKIIKPMQYLKKRTNEKGAIKYHEGEFNIYFNKKKTYEFPPNCINCKYVLTAYKHLSIDLGY